MTMTIIINDKMIKFYIPFFNSLVCNSSNLASSVGLIPAGSHPKSPGRVLLSIEAVRTSTAEMARRIY